MDDPPDVEAHPPVVRIGPYEVVGRLGVGGMGEVLRARDVRLRREVAIKVLPTSVAQDENLLARFEREVRILASLNQAPFERTWRCT